MSENPLDTYLEENRELLQEMEDILLQLEGGGDSEVMNALFRTAHTIKGSSGIFGFGHVVAFTHVVENVLDRLRDGEIQVSEDLVAALLASRDHISALVDSAIREEEALSEELSQQGDGILQRLARFQSTEVEDASAQAATPAVVASKIERENGPRVMTEQWHISIRFSENVFRLGLDPAPFLRYLKKLGEITHITTVFDGLPLLEAMDPESNYLGFEIALASDASKTEIEAAFEFAMEECTLYILPPQAKISEYADLIEHLPEEAEMLGVILSRCGALTDNELQMALHCQAQLREQAVPDDMSRLGEVLVKQQTVHPEVVDVALEKQAQVRNQRNAAKSVRVDAARLDSLINLVGELVIAGAGNQIQARRIDDEALLETVSSMSHLVEEIRDHALQLRMVPIGESFNRFNRVVRDVSKDLGKSIRLEIYGGDTELDKTVTEKIGDPLMHLVRNAMDHGLESAEEREAQGKPAEGVVYLNAFHDSGGIVIEVADDGAGLDPAKLLAKAREKGLVDANQELDKKEIYRLILEPGFSTAQEVTDLSGRGVGMDVVRRNIEALSGTVDIDSELGEGTTVRIRLPLSLAIIDGFLVGVGESSYVIPLDMVQECIELSEADTQESHGEHYINLRGEVLPFLRLRDVLSHQASEHDREQIVVVHVGTQKAGLVVDRLIGELQTVIKPLGKLFKHLSAIRGATILGSGEVAIILDVPTLIHRAVGERQAVVNQNLLQAADDEQGTRLH